MKSMFSTIGHAAVIATVAALALSAVAPAVAETGPARKGLSAPRDGTDFSARRRVHHGGEAAAARAYDAMGGTGPAMARSRNHGAYGNGNWDCSPVYCGPNYYRGDHYYGGDSSGEESSGGSSTPAVAW